MLPHIRHTLWYSLLTLSLTCIGAVLARRGILADPNESITWQLTARTKLIGMHGRVKQALFSPDDGIREVLLGLISGEKQRIILASYLVTDKFIVEALIKAHQRGIKVEIVVCRSGAQDQWSKVNVLIDAGIPVYVYPTGFVRSLMHNKFFVFFRSLDRTILATGSYNMTQSADKANQENFLFIDDGELARQYIARFETIKRLSVLLRKDGPLYVPHTVKGARQRAAKASFLAPKIRFP